MLHYLNDNLEPCTCSPEQVEEYLQTYFLDIDQSEPWRLKNTHAEYCSPGNATESCHDSQSGTMSAPLTENHGEDELMLFAVDSLAKTYQQQEKAPELKASDLECGSTWHELSVRYDRNTHSWKTHLCLWDEDLPWSSVTLPKLGMMRDGVCWEQSMQVRHIDETESGLWPTPAARDYKGANSREHCETNGTGRKHMDQLANAVAYPELRGCHAHAVKTGGAISTKYTPENAHVLKLMNGTAIHTQFATPQARDYRTGQQSRWNDPERSKNLNDQIGGQLNPTWVEWLMGWPLEWTDLKPLEMDKFRKWLHSHGKY